MKRRKVRKNSRWQWLGPFVFAGLGVAVAIGAAGLFDPPYVMTTGD